MVGSRTLVRVDLLERELQRLEPDLIISGGARGTDRAAEEWGFCWDLPVIRFRPEQIRGRWYVVRWAMLGGDSDRDVLPDTYTNFAAAAFTRNGLIVDASDEVLAMWDGHSTGTKDSIRKAEAAGKPLKVVRF